MSRAPRFSIFNIPPVRWLNYKVGLFAMFCWTTHQAYHRRNFIPLKLEQYVVPEISFFPRSIDSSIHCHRVTQDRSVPIRLVLTGAMNPPHPGHIMMAIKAMRKLKALGYDKVYIVICPSHDDYVRGKAFTHNRAALNIDTRIQLTQFLVDHMNELDETERQAITVFSYDNEKNNQQFLDHIDTLKSMQSELGQTESVVYLTGEDVFEKMHEMYEYDQISCIVIPRNSTALSSTNFLEGSSKTVSEVNHSVVGYYDFLQKMYNEKNCTYIPEGFDLNSLNFSRLGVRH